MTDLFGIPWDEDPFYEPDDYDEPDRREEELLDSNLWWIEYIRDRDAES